MTAPQVGEGIYLTGMDGSDPLALLASIGAVRTLSRRTPDARLRWTLRGRWHPVLDGLGDLDPVAEITADLTRWREEMPAAVSFAVGAERKVQDLKHPPREYREWMLQALESGDRDWAALAAAYATGVIADGSGQTKPTSLHFAAGQQRFMDVVLTLLDGVTEDDIREALFGPWIGRTGSKSLRWRAGSERSRALLSFDPGKRSGASVPGADWLAFRALPLFPVAAMERRVRTPGFSGRGKRESFTWPLWEAALRPEEIATLIAQDIDRMSPAERQRRGVPVVFRSAVVRSSQGYGSFAPSEPA